MQETITMKNGDVVTITYSQESSGLWTITAEDRYRIHSWDNFKSFPLAREMVWKAFGPLAATTIDEKTLDDS